MGEENQRGSQESWPSDAMRRDMEFIVRQQAQFTADMQRLGETQARAERRWERTEESVRALLAIAQLHDAEIKELAQSHTSLAESQARTDRQMRETDERLGALINVVERLVSERRDNGADDRRA